jgi:tetratricopeptide (TPR) repeat protein
VNTVPMIDPVEFVASVKPLIAANDVRVLIGALEERWSPTQIASLLAGDNVDGRKVAALCLGLVGRKCALEALRRALADRDSCVHQMAEHAMWSIWFRAGTDEANCQLARGAMALEHRDFACACKHFFRAIELDADFAEPYNQRAIVHYLREEYPESIIDCRRTIDRMPCHFGAWAGMGHCQAHLGNACEAIDSYSRALEINPGLDGIRQAIQQLRCASQ